MAVAEFNDVHRAYVKDAEVLNGVTFSVEEGRIAGLLGRNGAGKTTLIRIAMGMIEPHRGSVRILGLDPQRDPVEVKRRVGYVSEDQVFPPFLRASQVIDIHRQLYPSWDESLCRRLTDRFELPLGSKMKTLSKGQARQVALVCAISHRPELLLLDEPAGGLDPFARREFLETSIQLVNETGSTILFSSHHMTDVERMADRVVMIHDGRVLIDRDLDDLRENHALVLVPRDSSPVLDRLAELSGCIGVRERADGIHAIFNVEPERAARTVESSLGIRGVRSIAIALEDMFIELAGGNHARASAS